MGFLLRGPHAKAEVDVSVAKHDTETDGGGEDYEEESGK